LDDVDFTMRKFAIWTHFKNPGQTRFFTAVFPLRPNERVAGENTGVAPRWSANSVIS
jgi:hypothetical protein